MRAPDEFTGPANTGDSGVFTATAMSLLVGHSEEIPRRRGNSQAPVLGARKPGAIASRSGRYGGQDGFPARTGSCWVYQRSW